MTDSPSLSEMPTATWTAWSRERIEESRCPNVDGRYFVPEGTLEKILTKDIIRLVLGECEISPIDITELSQIVIRGARKTFAVLIMIGWPQGIRRFAEHDSLGKTSFDSKLPYDCAFLSSILHGNTGDMFFKQQWEQVAPNFGGELEHRFLDNNTIMPFIEKRPVGQGAFGSVYSLVIHPGHCDLAESATNGIPPRGRAQTNRQPGTRVALKVLERHDTTKTSEIEILKLVRPNGHPNIIELLGSYDYCDSVNILLPYMSGDLNSLLRTDKLSDHFRTEADVLFGLCGLASAIQTLHNHVSGPQGNKLAIIHHDIKPSNILVADQGFVLADFALASITNVSESNRGVLSEYPGMVDLYTSPELDHNFAGIDKPVPVVSRASDIFSLGCIFAEIVTYLLNDGAGGVLAFKESRRTQVDGWMRYSFHSNGGPNPGVSQWLLRLRQKATTTSANLISLIEDMLRISPTARPDAEFVTHRLRHLALSSKALAINDLYGRCLVGHRSPQLEHESILFRILTRTFDASGEDHGKHPHVKLDAIFGYVVVILTAISKRLGTILDSTDTLAAVIPELSLLNRNLQVSMSTLPKSSLAIAHQQRSNRDALPSQLANRSTSSLVDSEVSNNQQGSTLPSSLDQEISPQPSAPPKTTSSDADIQSVASDKDEIGSQRPTRRSPEELIAESRFAAFLAENNVLGPLFDEALFKIGKNRFAENLRRLLKICYLDLLPHAKTNLERATNQLLRGRLSRVRLARLIVEMRKPESDEIHEQQRIEIRDKSQYLEDWIASNMGSAHNSSLGASATGIFTHTDQDHSSNPSSDSEDSVSESEEENKKLKILPNIEQMESFLSEAQAFRNLIINLCIFLLPVSLKPLIRCIMSVPNEQISFSLTEDYSIGNVMKIFLEKITEDDWEWWPLRPKMQFLRKDQVRILWKCHCNTQLWSEVSKVDAQKIEKLLVSRGSVIPDDHLCRIRKEQKRGIWIAVRKGIRYVVGAGANQRPWYSMSSFGSSSQQNRPASSRRNRNACENALGSQATATQQQGCQVNINMPQIPESRVLFGVKGPRLTLELDEIKILAAHDDNDLLRSIREEHKRPRGWLRYWFSVWQLQHCDFVKFKKIIEDRIIYDEKTLPEDPKYDYHPRAPDALCPPITPHEFSLALAACGTRCINLSPFHDCIRPLCGDTWLQKIPKWKAQSDWKQSGLEYGWGLQAHHVISFIYVIAYHFLIFASTFGFWGWYQVRHTDDLQNAAVPLTTVALLLSLFWSSYSVLRLFREPL